MPAIQVGDVTIPYRLRRSSRARRLRLVVAPGGVEVVAPARARASRIEAFVRSRAGWLYRRTAALRRGDSPALPERFVDGATVVYRGRQLALRVEPVDRARVRLRLRDHLHLEMPRHLDADERERRARERVVGWLREQARQAARALFARHAPGLGVAPAGLRIGDQRTLWGSCSSRGVVSLNYRLIAAPPKVFEYVVVHELCHLREPHHGPAFWRLVAEVLPDYRREREWLKERGLTLG